MSVLQNKYQLLKTITLRRGYNALMVLSSYFLSKWFKKNLHCGMPISIAIEPTTSCNLRCPECPSGLRSFTRNTGMLIDDSFKKIINEVHPYTNYLTFYFQGEPYLNPQFLEMVKYAVQKNIYTTTSTNAHYLNDENSKKTIESGLHQLLISIDGTTQETYSAYRIGGQLSKVIEGTKNIVKWKKELKSATPHIVFQFLVVKPNQHQLAEVAQLAKELGIDEVKYKTAQVYDYENGNELIPTIDKYSRYKKIANGKFQIKNPLNNHCWKMWQSCVITWDGDVVPCCFDKDAKHRLGNSIQKPFKEIWNGVDYHHFRTQVLGARSNIDICNNCSEGGMVWV